MKSLSLRMACIYVMLLAAISMALSCATQKKAEKYYALNPGKLAAKCAAEFPAKDSTIIVKDSTGFDTLVMMEPVFIFDTLYVEGEARIIKRECPPTKVITRHTYTTTTITKLDAALHKAQTDSIKTINKQLTIQETKNAEQKGKTNWWRIVAIVSIGINALIIAFLILRK